MNVQIASVGIRPVMVDIFPLTGFNTTRLKKQWLSFFLTKKARELCNMLIARNVSIRQVKTVTASDIATHLYGGNSLQKNDKKTQQTVTIVETFDVLWPQGLYFETTPSSPQLVGRHSCLNLL